FRTTTVLTVNLEIRFFAKMQMIKDQQYKVQHSF
ncbi:uncharacterized protein WCI35_007594, partial [Daubentonia madagascariensis]